MSIAIIIPARLASSRLPRKLLLTETGRPLIQHTYESATRSTLAKEIVVATDSTEIADAVRAFGGRVEFTSPEFDSGTDRVAEAAARLKNAEVIVNIQGDEPEIDGTSIDLAIDALARDQEAVMSTLATPIRSKQRLCQSALEPASGRQVKTSHCERGRICPTALLVRRTVKCSGIHGTIQSQLQPIDG